MMRRKLGLAGAFVLLLGGCHRGWSVHGRVVDVSGAPIAGAIAHFRCGPVVAKIGPVGNFVTKDDGTFVAAGGVDDDPGPTCSLEIIVSGHHTATFGVSEACYRSSNAGNFGEACDDRKLVVP
ncbi:hypothetical protein BH09MYX1_BH09MYX1_46690 [soil metagenome]